MCNLLSKLNLCREKCKATSDEDGSSSDMRKAPERDEVSGPARILHQGRGRCADAGASAVAREGRSPMPIGIGEHLSASSRSPDDPIWLSDSRHETVGSAREKVHQRGRPDEISGLGQRLGALLYESVLLFGVLFFVAAIVHTLRPGWDAQPWALRAILFVTLGAYFCYCWHKSGQTLAMKTWHLRLMCYENGLNSPRPISWTRAVVRYFALWTMLIPGGALVWMAQWRGANALIVLLASFFLMWVIGLLSHDRRMLHDRIAGTRIESVRKHHD